MEHIRRIWPSAKELADDLDRPYTTVHSWFARDRVPAAHDLELVEAAARRGKNLTLEELARARRATTGDAA